MPYVMVPVPEEHEQEFMGEIMQMTLRQSLTGWKPADLQELLEQAEPGWRSLIEKLTFFAADDRHPRRTAIATALGVDEEAVTATADAINARCAERSWPYLVFSEDEPGEAGGEPMPTMYINKVAGRILAPLLDGAG